MILPLLLQVAAPPPSDMAPDVVVIGERLKRWTGRITSNPLVTRCRTTTSTGNAAIDAIGCRAMEVCWPEARRGLKQVGDKRLPAADRERIKAETEATFGTCTKTQRTTLIADLVARGTVRDGVYQ